MKKKAIVVALALSASVLVSTVPTEAGFRFNGIIENGIVDNGIVDNGSYFTIPTTGLDFTTISHHGLGK